MKIDTIEVKINPINLLIENNRLFGILAFLFDRDRFLEDIYNTRLQISSRLPISHEVIKEIYKLYSYYEKGLILKKEAKQLQEIVKKTFNYAHNDDLFDIVICSLKLAKKITRKYKKEQNYIKPILYALLCNEVTQKDYFSATFPLIIKPKSSFQTNNKIVALVITKNSTVEEIQAEFKKLFNSEFNRERFIFKNQLARLKKVKQKELISLEGAEKELLEWHIKDINKELKKKGKSAFDTISNIKRDRKFYWLNKQGMSAARIHEETKEGRNLTESGINKAISQYKKRIGGNLI